VASTRTQPAVRSVFSMYSVNPQCRRYEYDSGLRARRTRVYGLCMYRRSTYLYLVQNKQGLDCTIYVRTFIRMNHTNSSLLLHAGLLVGLSFALNLQWTAANTGGKRSGGSDNLSCGILSIWNHLTPLRGRSSGHGIFSWLRPTATLPLCACRWYCI
jgi:hypothetical protein